MDKVINELSKIYPEVRFKKSYRNRNEILLYDNEQLQCDEKFFSIVMDLAEKYLTEDQVENFAFIYDYFDEISIGSSSDVYVNEAHIGKGHVLLEKEFNLRKTTIFIKVVEKNESREDLTSYVYPNSKLNLDNLEIKNVVF